MKSGFIYETTDGAPIKHWTRGVQLEDAAHGQLHNVASLPFIHKHVAAMPGFSPEAVFVDTGSNRGEAVDKLPARLGQDARRSRKSLPCQSVTPHEI